MKSYCWSLIVIVFALGSLRAEDSPKTKPAGGESASVAEQYQNNPDDAKAFTAWLNETFKEISELMDSTPEDAEKKLTAAKEFLGELKPESAEIGRASW